MMQKAGGGGKRRGEATVLVRPAVNKDAIYNYMSGECHTLSKNFS